MVTLKRRHRGWSQLGSIVQPDSSWGPVNTFMASLGQLELSVLTESYCDEDLDGFGVGWFQLRIENDDMEVDRLPSFVILFVGLNKDLICIYWFVIQLGCVEEFQSVGASSC